MEKHLHLLGWEVQDRVTGLKAVVTHIGLDLYGCVQALIQPQSVTKETGEDFIPDQRWMDVSRLEKCGNSRKMEPIPQKGDLSVAGSDCSKPTK